MYQKIKTCFKIKKIRKNKNTSSKIDNVDNNKSVTKAVVKTIKKAPTKDRDWEKLNAKEDKTDHSNNKQIRSRKEYSDKSKNKGDIESESKTIVKNVITVHVKGIKWYTNRN